MKKILSLFSAERASLRHCFGILATSLAGLFCSLYAADYGGGPNPWVRCEVKREGKDAVLRWFGDEGVPCQVEWSTNLSTWTESGSIVVGSNAWVSVKMAMADSDRCFFRVRDFAATAEASGGVTASFLAVSGTLAVFGTGGANTIEVSRDAAGQLLVNGGAVAIRGGSANVANTALIQIFGLGGNDTLSLNEANGALPPADLFGGNGNDTLSGGSGNDQLFGESGVDTLFGKGGFDFLFGGPDNDTATGGDADDQIFLGGGNDRSIWNPGDDTDLVEGGDGTDTVEVNGGGGAEQFTTTANGARVRFDRLNPAPFSLDMGTCENLVLNANGGDDSFSATGSLAGLLQITVDGGGGNDTILGSNGADLLLGGDGDDFVDGQQGNDVALLGAGNDTFQWDPGDGSDVVEGQDNSDTLLFNGSAGDELFTVSANGSRVLFVRNLGNIVMDLADVEQIDLNTLGGADTVTVNDLAGTDLLETKVRLSGILNGTTGDARVDTVIVNGSNGNDAIEVVGGGTAYSVIGLSAVVSVSQSEGTNDVLVVNALGGNDSFTASTLLPGIVKLTVDGGAGNDILFGSDGVDTLLGGAGDDLIDGEEGNDIALMGADNDTFQWGVGDGSDIVEGQDGADRLVFSGSNAGENIEVSASTNRVRFTRDVSSVSMDLNDVERIDFNAFGGADNILVGNLSGTDTTNFNIRLNASTGLGDGSADIITVNGSNGDDAIFASGNGTNAIVTGLFTTVNVTRTEEANDRLVINGLGGNDVLDASGLSAEVIRLTMNGGLGNDVLMGGENNDLVNGGDGNDVALLGPGDDTFVWNPGDDNDTIEGQDGRDTLLFNGSNAAENIDLSANGGRLRFFRNVANVLMDCSDVETVHFNALGGADTIVVNDLSGTDVTEVNVALAGVGTGVGDASADTVIVSGTALDDTALLTGDAAGVNVFGLAALVRITGSEAANDRVTLNMLAGDDVIEASGLPGGFIQLTGDGGADNDVLVGSGGPDVLSGGAGDDVLLGGPGVDVLDGGLGDDVVIQD